MVTHRHDGGGGGGERPLEHPHGVVVRGGPILGLDEGAHVGIGSNV